MSRDLPSHGLKGFGKPWLHLISGHHSSPSKMKLLLFSVFFLSTVTLTVKLECPAVSVVPEATTVSPKKTTLRKSIITNGLSV